MSRLFNLYRKLGNKKPMLMMTDTLNKCNKRKKELMNSYRGVRVVFTIEPAKEDEVKFKKKPHNQWKNYDKPKSPKRQR